MLCRTSAFTILLLLVLLQACSGGSFGFGKTVPDEFRVVSHPPLEVPEEFTLPSPGKKRISPYASQNISHTVVVLTQADYHFLSLFGNNIPDIRQVVDTEYSNYKSSIHTKVTDALGIVSIGKDSPFSTVVDPVAEQERIKKLKVIR